MQTELYIHYFKDNPKIIEIKEQKRLLDELYAREFNHLKSNLNKITNELNEEIKKIRENIKTIFSVEKTNKGSYIIVETDIISEEETKLLNRKPDENIHKSKVFNIINNILYFTEEDNHHNCYTRYNLIQGPIDYNYPDSKTEEFVPLLQQGIVPDVMRLKLDFFTNKVIK